jgi:hypothetical protein
MSAVRRRHLRQRRDGRGEGRQRRRGDGAVLWAQRQSGLAWWPCWECLERKQRINTNQPVDEEQCRMTGGRGRGIEYMQAEQYKESSVQTTGQGNRECLCRNGKRRQEDYELRCG